MLPKKCNTFKALGIFLWYPDALWVQGVDELCDIIEQENLLVDEDKKAIRAFANDLKNKELFEAQEEYVETFDRVRSLSLHLFEHVHGESRDRGQAMVDLSEVYKEQGVVLAKSEMPDYIPVFLEYLSLIDKDEAFEMLAQPAHVLVSIGKKLAERASPYSAVFNSLIRLAGAVPAKIDKIIPAADISFAQMDKEWEEKPIEFLGAEAPETSCAPTPKTGGCGGGGCGGGGCGGSAQPNENMKQGAC